MHRTLAIAALVAASAAAPLVMTTPATAAPSAYPANCLVLPLLQAECRAIWRDAWDGGVDGEAVLVTTAATSTERAISWPIPAWWNCSVAAEGAGHLFDCK